MDSCIEAKLIARGCRANDGPDPVSVAPLDVNGDLINGSAGSRETVQFNARAGPMKNFETLCIKRGNPSRFLETLDANTFKEQIKQSHQY